MLFRKYLLIILGAANSFSYGMCEISDYDRPIKEEIEQINQTQIEEAKRILAMSKNIADADIPEAVWYSDKHIELAKQFLTRGVSPNKPLLIATNQLAVETTRLLLEFGANPNYRECNKMTPLHILGATYNNHPGDTQKKITIAKLLLQHGAQQHLKDEKGRTPLEISLGHFFFQGEQFKGFISLAKLLNSESRYRLFIEIESARRKNLTSLSALPKDVIKEIIFWTYPKLNV